MEVEKPSLILVVIVPASSLLNTKLGVLSVVGVEMAVTAAKVGAVVSIVTLPVPLVTAVPELEDVSEKAIEYAENNNIDYTVIEPQKKEFVIKSYSDNFLKE